MNRQIWLIFFIVLVSIGLLKTGYVSIGNPEPVVAAVSPSTPPIIPIPQPTKLSSDILWSLIQDWRVKNNFQSYIKDQSLCDIAKIRLTEIKTDFSHAGFRKRFYGDKPWNYPYTRIAENLAIGIPESQALEGWLNSPKHRKALDANYKYSCIEADGPYAVQLFANY